MDLQCIFPCGWAGLKFLVLRLSQVAECSWSSSSESTLFVRGLYIDPSESRASLFNGCKCTLHYGKAKPLRSESLETTFAVLLRIRPSYMKRFFFFLFFGQTRRLGNSVPSNFKARISFIIIQSWFSVLWHLTIFFNFSGLPCLSRARQLTIANNPGPEAQHST